MGREGNHLMVPKWGENVKDNNAWDVPFKRTKGTSISSLRNVRKTEWCSKFVAKDPISRQHIN